jgi:hypothetical protein
MIYLCVIGSTAAGFQSRIGNVRAGSVFADMQSAGTEPLSFVKIGATVGAAVGIATVVSELKTSGHLHL